MRPIPAGAYLAASWTWVIGMFFPVLLTGEFGWWAWLVFAAPNVIGAASVGLLLRRPGAASAFRERHTNAMAWFSLVTIAFQFYAGAWIVRVVLGGRNADLLPGVLRELSVTAGMTLFVALVAGFALLPFRVAARVAISVLLVSLLTFVLASVGVFVDPDGAGGFALPPAPDEIGPAVFGLACVAPVIVAGFLLCPYLDLTINRVRRETAEPAGSYAFAGGFGGPFLLMILGTLGYAGYYAEHRTLPLIIVLHVIVQAAFTAGVHIRAVFSEPLLRVSTRRRGRRPLSAWKLFLATFLILMMGPLGNASPDFGMLRPGYSFSQLGYESFMLMYGVVFPLAMWCFAVRPWGLRGVGSSARLIAFATACGLALPTVAAGYLFERWWLAAVGIAVGFAAPVIVARFSSPNRQPGTGSA